VGLVPGALAPELFEDIPVYSEGDGLLRRGDHHFRIVPEVVREIRQLGWRRAGLAPSPPRGKGG
jgi:hypothetical protein